jgi:hypothetical protein
MAAQTTPLYVSKIMHRTTKKIALVVAQGIIVLRILGTGVEMIPN